MITCRHVAELLLDYLAGELPPEQHDHVLRHLSVCSPCITFVETYELTIKLTRQLPPQPLPPQLAERLHAALYDIQKGRMKEEG